MHKHNIVFIGFDTHKTFTEVAHIEDFYGAKPVHHGKIKNNQSGNDQTRATIPVQIPASHTAFCV